MLSRLLRLLSPFPRVACPPADQAGFAAAIASTDQLARFECEPQVPGRVAFDRAAAGDDWVDGFRPARPRRAFYPLEPARVYEPFADLSMLQRRTGRPAHNGRA